MAKQSPPNSSGSSEDTRDLGFGSRLAREARVRFLNPDGTFNVRRSGIPFWRSINPYHALLTISWPRFFAIFIACYFIINTVFAIAYYLCGAGALGRPADAPAAHPLLDGFFFSVQTLATIGYGGLAPRSLSANVLVTIESLIGLLFFAIGTGLIFARFARPVAHVIFSRNAIIAPYHAINAFEFRAVNVLRSQLVDVEARVSFSRLAERGGRMMRIFDDLPLERKSVTFFPLHWTVAHPIDENSLLFGLTPDDLEKCDAEFIVMLAGFDETFSQIVHTRTSYKFHEIITGAKFADMFIDSPDGIITVDLKKLHDFEPIESTP